MRFGWASCVVGAQKTKCAAFQFLARLAGRLCGHSRRQRSVHQRVSKPHRASSLARAQDWPVRWTAHASCLQARIYRPTARPILARLRTPIVPPLLGLPKLNHPARPPFPVRNGPRAARALSTSASTRGASIPLPSRLPHQWEGHVSPWPASHSGGKPPQSMRWGDPARRLRIRKAF